MKDDHLDDIIKAKLQNLQVDQQPMDWNIFAEKLDHANSGGPANADDQEFDQVIFERLNRFTASGINKEKHWALFERQLHQLANFREQLLKYKLVEAILVSLLLLLTVELGFPTVTPSPLSKPNVSERFMADQQANGQATTNTIASSQAPNMRTTAEAITPSNNKVGTELAINTSNDGRFVVAPSGPISAPNDPTFVDPISIISQHNAAIQSPASIEVQALIADQEVVQSQAPVGPLAKIEPSENLLLDFGHQPGLEAKVNPVKRTNLQISMLGGADYNQVMTPENTDKAISAYDRFSLGYRGGLMLDVGRINSRLRMGTGLIYTAKTYEVNRSILQGSLLLRGARGLTAETLDNIELNIVNLPVFARYDVVQGRRWSVFAHAGFAMQVAIQANYYVNFPDFPQPTRIGQTPKQKSQFEDRNGGFLEGGSFNENSFFTGNMGLGLERHVADRWSLFMQSRYEYSIGYFSAGLGPNQDRINTMSFESGIRVKLK